MSSSSTIDTYQPGVPQSYENALRHVGRVLLGLYFIAPGISKLFGWESTAAYMTLHGVPLVVPLLALTVVLQIGGGLMLAIGYRARLTAFVLAGLAFLINVFMHDFWNSYDGVDQAHEIQNFIKNLAIIAGLLYVAGTRPVLRNRD